MGEAPLTKRQTVRYLVQDFAGGNLEDTAAGLPSNAYRKNPPMYEGGENSDYAENENKHSHRIPFKEFKKKKLVKKRPSGQFSDR